MDLDSTQTSLTILRTVVDMMSGARREGQEDMLRQVCQALESRTPLIIQAGTGTGKSLAYIVPALVWARNNEAAAVISTATLALQRQLIARDIPMAIDAYEQVVGQRPTAAVLKGWSNYLCLHKARHYASAQSLLAAARSVEDEGGAEDEGDQGGRSSDDLSVLEEDLERLSSWAARTESGDLDDLKPGVSPAAWSMMSLSSRECLGNECLSQSDCFAYRARTLAAAADLVVTNHAMIAINATLPVDVVPDHDALIVDEAHELVERVRTQGAYGMSEMVVRRAINRLVREAAISAPALTKQASQLGKILDSYDEQLLEHIPDDVRKALEGVADAARATLKTCPSQIDDDALALKTARSILHDLIDSCEQIEAAKPHSHAMWIEGEDMRKLTVAPLNVGQTIVNELINDRAAVFTSATLRVGKDFSAFARDVGCSALDYDSADVGSPFRYREQAIMYVASDIPVVKKSGMSDEALSRMSELIEASNGGALCLFSSHRALRQAAEHMEGCARNVYVQGDGPLGGLVDAFKEDMHGVLMGTMSLWQGVDMPGLGCRLVIIDRIPFSPPNDPLFQARSKQAKAQGLSDFATISIPSAAIKLAQGVGRLVRSSDDRGVVALLDPRLVTKRYGAMLLSSLPKMWETTDAQIVCDALARLAATVDAGEGGGGESGGGVSGCEGGCEGGALDL